MSAEDRFLGDIESDSSDVGAADPDLLEKFTMSEEEKQDLINGRLVLMSLKSGLALLQPKYIRCADCDLEFLLVSVKENEDGTRERVDAFVCCCPHCGALM